MSGQRAAIVYDGEDVERCRRARRDFEKRFKTLDEMFDHCERLRKRRATISEKPKSATSGRATAKLASKGGENPHGKRRLQAKKNGARVSAALEKRLR